MNRTDLIEQLKASYATSMKLAQEYFHKWTVYRKQEDKESEMMHTGSAFATLGMIRKVESLTEL